ncbi:MAG: hypothetical protein ACXQTS_01885 [Candidatus Methanospirareceae archaeon]
MRFIKAKKKGERRRLSLKARFVRWLLRGVPLEEIRVGSNTIEITSTAIDMDGGNINNIGGLSSFTARGDITPDADNVRSIGTSTARVSGAFTGVEFTYAQAKGDIIPDTNKTRNLGNSSARFLAALGNVDIDGNIIPATDNAYRIGTSSARFSGAFTDLEFTRGYARGDIIPDGNKTRNLGSSSARFLAALGNVDLEGHITPSADATYRIGNETYTFSGAFSDIYLKGKDNRIYSEADCYGFIGYKTVRRFSGVYAAEVVTGDMCFQEFSCEICGREFTPGEMLTLLMKRVDEEGNSKIIRTVPVHLECYKKRVN